MENDKDLNLKMFIQVGRNWGWYERLHWTDERWQLFFRMHEVHFYLGFRDSKEIGYFELIHHPSDEMEIKHFGLLPEYIGKGLGGLFLSQAIHTAWRFYPKSIFLYTAQTDSPSALANYLARGFKIEYEETRLEIIPSAAEYQKALEQVYA